MSIEDDIFMDALSALKLKLNKSMYEPAKYPHKCCLCTEDNNETGYKLKIEERFINEYYSEMTSPAVYDPYLFICKECYEELPDGE